MKTISLYAHAGSFAENKDIARGIRLQHIIPALDAGDDVTLDFKDIDGATQSFIHALISDLIRNYGNEVIERLYFKNCNTTVQKIISIVIEYMQEAE